MVPRRLRLRFLLGLLGREAQQQVVQPVAGRATPPARGLHEVAADDILQHPLGRARVDPRRDGSHHPTKVGTDSDPSLRNRVWSVAGSWR